MRHQPTSNGGFRWQEISRAKFQETTASILGEHAAKVKAQGEFMADMSMRLDEHSKQLQIHQSAFDAWGARPFMARLRWLFQGK